MKSTDKDFFRKRVERNNKLAKIIISAGGYGVIISIIFILLFLVYQSMPLSFKASLKEMFSVPLGSSQNMILTGLDQYQEVYYLLDDQGKISFYQTSDNSMISADSVGLQANEKILTAGKMEPGKDRFAVGTDQGRIITGQIRMHPVYERNKRVVVPEYREQEAYHVQAANDSLPAHVEMLTYRSNEDGAKFWAWTDHSGNLLLQVLDEYDEATILDLSKKTGGAPITTITMDYAAENLIAGTMEGELFWFDLTDVEDIYLRENWKASDAPISTTEFLLGNSSLVIGNTSGQVQIWMPVRNAQNKTRYKPVNLFKDHPAAIVQIYASPRNRTFFTVDAKGTIHLNYSTTNQTQIEFKATDRPIRTGAIAPKSNGIILVDNQNKIGHFHLQNDHPESTFKTLFQKVWYEGYEKPEFVWQSTGGSDEFEPKFSLIPLIFGTLKGTLYAMLFSLPLALLAAIYVSQFSPKWLARIVKPTVEIMAALPSVVIGFLAGLYFSPLFEKYLMFIFVILVVLPVVLLLGILVWRLVPESVRLRAPLGWDLIFVIPLVLIGFWISMSIARPMELALFSNDIKQWLYDVFNVTYDQRNSMVVGFALGFAVVPIIFTISEDALSNVPESLTSASLALGASRWQTVRRIILPAAAGGIFAATMLGLGRAIGETMIVLMATGNTPILDLSPFNGFRAMSACIAVEIPEAPVGGTLYRILFFTAFLLFIFTFMINSIAAFISDRLRKKYARF